MGSATPRLVTYAIPTWGIGELALLGARPIHHASPDPDRQPGAVHLDAPACDPEAADPAERLVGQVGRFLAGERIRWTAEDLELDASCDEWGYAPFQRAVAHALCDVGYGERVTYGELAERAGAPRAHRAAGTFCAQNRLGLFLPCHRIVPASGGVGTYGPQGIRYKARLLALEERAVAA